MDRHHVSQPDSQVLPDNLVDSDTCFFHGVVHQDDANSVLTLLALRPYTSEPSAFLRLLASLTSCVETRRNRISSTFSRTVSPRNSCSASIVALLRATTELSSLTASSTMSLFGLFLRSRIAVLKSFLSPWGFLLQFQRLPQCYPAPCYRSAGVITVKQSLTLPQGPELKDLRP